jgi:hypothetical protein
MEKQLRLFFLKTRNARIPKTKFSVSTDSLPLPNKVFFSVSQFSWFVQNEFSTNHVSKQPLNILHSDSFKKSACIFRNCKYLFGFVAVSFGCTTSLGINPYFIMSSLYLLLIVLDRLGSSQLMSILLVPGSPMWRARNVLVGSALGAGICFPLGTLNSTSS